MKQTQVVALVLVALFLGVVIGMKVGKSQAAPASTAAPVEPVASTGTDPAPAAVGPALPRLVDLGSTTCIPCIKMAPILEELKIELKGKVEVEFINVNENTAAADKYKISVIPAQIFFDKDGKEVLRHQGFMPKADILAQLENMGVSTH